MSKLSNFVQAGVDIKTNDVITFVDAGVVRSAEETPFNREVFQITVKLPNGQTKTLTMNRTSMRAIAKAFGDDTKEWVGKQATAVITEQNVRGVVRSVIYLMPVRKKGSK